MCWPSTHPSLRRSDQHASRRDRFPEEAPRIRDPLRGTCAGGCASGGSGTARRARVTRYPRRWCDMGQSSRMRSTLTSQSAVEPSRERSAGLSNQGVLTVHTSGRPLALSFGRALLVPSATEALSTCGTGLLDQGETTAKRSSRSSATPIRRERVIRREVDDVGAATQRCCPRVRSPFLG